MYNSKAIKYVVLFYLFVAADIGIAHELLHKLRRNEDILKSDPFRASQKIVSYSPNKFSPILKNAKIEATFNVPKASTKWSGNFKSHWNNYTTSHTNSRSVNKTTSNIAFHSANSTVNISTFLSNAKIEGNESNAEHGRGVVNNIHTISNLNMTNNDIGASALKKEDNPIRGTSFSDASFPINNSIICKDQIPSPRMEMRGTKYWALYNYIPAEKVCSL